LLPSSKLINSRIYSYSLTNQDSLNSEGIKVLAESKVLIILENRDYMSMLKEKLAEIKGVFRSLKLAPVRI